MVRALAAAAVLHGAPRLLIENNSEEEDKRTLEGWTAEEKKRSQENEGSGQFRREAQSFTCRQLKPANR